MFHFALINIFFVCCSVCLWIYTNIDQIVYYFAGHPAKCRSMPARITFSLFVVLFVCGYTKILIKWFIILLVILQNASLCLQESLYCRCFFGCSVEDEYIFHQKSRFTADNRPDYAVIRKEI